MTCDGTDANAEQVRAGMAWVFERYVTDRSLYDVGLLRPVAPVAPGTPR